MIKKRIKKRIKKISILFDKAAEKGVFLILAAILGAWFANSESLSDTYRHLLHSKVSIGFGFSHFSLSFEHFINDFLMAIFFLLIGMEIKQEIVSGHLATWRQRSLPLVCALGGMIAPIIIYLAFNYNNDVAMRGWAIPGATDIAFALGMLALFGKGLPVSLRVFLTALAIIDDLLAVIIIALFYSGSISNYYMAMIFFVVALLFLFNRMEIFSLLIYMAAGLLLWYCFFQSGVHATIGGVILGFLVPIGNDEVKPLKHLQKSLEKFVALIVLPLFAFANCGIAVGGQIDVFNTIALGTFLGLFIGKQIGVMATGFVAIKTGFSKLPQYANWLQFYGIAVLCGIGFTMSLFIAILAFEDFDNALNYAKLGIMAGSVVSALFAALILRIAKR